jgi:hypothetical protein
MRRAAVLLSLLVFCANGQAARNESIRAERRLGALVGIVDPYPSLIGLLVGWQFSASLRGELGVGRQNLDLSHLTTWAVGVKFFVPHWNLSPFASVHVAAVSHEGATPIMGFSRSGAHAYGGIGVEWMTEEGFTAGLGYRVSTKGSTSSMPMLEVGWFFSL